MWVMDPTSALAPNEARVLEALLRIDVPVTGRAVARITGLSQSTAQRALTKLRQAGLAVAESAPPSLLFRANPDHLAMPALLTLLRLDDQLRARIAEHVAEWRPPPVSVVVYGSVARGRATAGSDVDLLVVRPDTIRPDQANWQRQVADLADRVQRWTGRRASIVDLARHEAAQGLADREQFLVEADRDGWLVAGDALRELAWGRT
jgi:predicted nucleotidyltransferase